MRDYGKNTTKPFKPAENADAEKVTRYTKASYFQKKDKKAVEFLKKHPIPARFLK